MESGRGELDVKTVPGSPFIEPGKPIRSVVVESCNDRRPDECLNEHWFLSLGNPLRIVEPWREDYIIEGSLGTLAYQPQAEVQQALVELRIREQQMTFPRKSWSSPEVRIPVLGLTRTAGRL